MNRKIGYIGFGSIVSGYHYTTAMREDVPFTPTAVYDVDPARRALAEERGLQTFDNLADFLASHLFELVVIGIPNQYHCEYACAALEAGYHVMCEKPVAMSVEELEKMIATAEKTGKMFTVHQNRRYDRDALIVKEVIAGGKLGNLISVESRVHSANGNGQMFGWRMFADHGGGYFGDWGIHVLDQVLDVVRSPIRSVYGIVKTLGSTDAGEDYTKIIITFKDGLTAQIEATDFAPLPLPKWMVYGDKGALRVDGICGETGKLRCIKKSHVEETPALVYLNESVSERSYGKVVIDEWEERTVPEVPITQDWAKLYLNLAGYLDGKEPLAVDPAGVLRCFRVLEAAKRSSETGEAVLFD
ncbi:MAG: Gfo/Idh/MocA family oxidoreductase [Clostridia bacterium]|nr:Gfo/Idh/MocA family oxidoreductase [Clostridia bacterium]